MSEKGFKSFPKAIFELLSEDKLFIVPEYQRQYSWRTKELEQLWNDFTDSYANPGGEAYFFGSVVVAKPKGSRSDDRELIVDGQQRITTLMIMFTVLERHFSGAIKDLEIEFDRKKQKIDLSKLIYANDKSKLKLQDRNSCNVSFDCEVVRRETFAPKEIVEKEYSVLGGNSEISERDIRRYKEDIQRGLGLANPKNRFINAGMFFYENFLEFQEKYGNKELEKLIRYILSYVLVIKIVCEKEDAAIKLFLTLNDRGKSLLASDVIRTYIWNRYSDENLRSKFEKKWQEIENLCDKSSVDLSMDEFLYCYNFYKLESYPRSQIIDDMRSLIDGTEKIDELVYEIKLFSEGVEKIFSTPDGENRELTDIKYSLRYVTWRTHAIGAMATAYKEGYRDILGLFKELRRFYYLSWIAGKSLNGIKQTSFNIIKRIKEHENLEKITKYAEEYITDNELVKKARENLKGNVYDEKFLKPVLLSVDYTLHEEGSYPFRKNNKKIHADHIIPRKFDGVKVQDEWRKLKRSKLIDSSLNTLGNMALLLDVQNIEALNHGLYKKLQIYDGHNVDSQKTAFVTTQKVIDLYKEYRDEERSSNITSKEALDKIEKREKYLRKLIYEMLDIPEEKED